MSSNNPNVEILVHITAPSKASDDANYRALAAAYQCFEPAVKTDLGTFGQTDRPSSPEGRREQGQRHEQLTGPEERHGNIPTTQLSFGFNSSNISFGSADHNLRSPALRRTRTDAPTQVTDSQSSWRAPPSVIADSNPENNISVAQYCSPTRILEHYLQGFDSSQSSSSQAILTAPVSSPAATRQATVPASQTPVGRTSQQLPSPSITGPSVIPQSPFLAGRKRSRQDLSTSKLSETDVVTSSIPTQQPATSQLRAEAVQPEVAAVIPFSAQVTRQPRSLSLSAVDIIPSSRAESESGPLLKRQRRFLAEVNGSSLVRSSSDVGPRQEQAKSSLLAQRQQAKPGSDGLEIRSPEPPVSCSDLDVSHVITPRLEKLARDVRLDKRFEQRKKQTRELRPFERGYWLVDCSSWPEEARHMAWGFLGNYVGNGLAGWGIWCRRDDDYKSMRLYCWGCAAGYMFLVLWLSSQRELNYVESTWVAGGGEVVITMDPKYERP